VVAPYITFMIQAFTVGAVPGIFFFYDVTVTKGGRKEEAEEGRGIFLREAGTELQKFCFFACLCPVGGTARFRLASSQRVEDVINLPQLAQEIPWTASQLSSNTLTRNALHYS